MEQEEEEEQSIVGEKQSNLVLGSHRVPNSDCVLLQREAPNLIEPREIPWWLPDSKQRPDSLTISVRSLIDFRTL
jgi:hypothetical protein